MIYHITLYCKFGHFEHLFVSQNKYNKMISVQLDLMHFNSSLNTVCVKKCIKRKNWIVRQNANIERYIYMPHCYKAEAIKISYCCKTITSLTSFTINTQLVSWQSARIANSYRFHHSITNVQQHNFTLIMALFNLMTICIKMAFSPHD